MPIDAHKMLVQRYYIEIINHHALQLCDTLFAPDFISHATNGNPVSLNRYLELLKQSFTAFPDIVVSIEDQIAEDDKVVTRWRATGTHRGELMGLPATGKRFEVSAIHIHRIQNNQLVEHWEEIDLFGLMQQIGAA